jgi:ferric-dicitrate binding protein FerR (iron transport regulator)
MAAAAVLCAQSPQNTRTSLEDVAGCARLVAFTGQISVLRDSTLWALNADDYVQPGQVIVTGADGSGMFKVSDGSTFEVFPKSKVVFRANRSNWEDLLEIMLGKIKVQIEHPGGLPNKNKIRTPTAVISVRGTTFDVEYDPDKEATIVLDEEGSVEVARALRLDDRKVLNPNETVIVYKNSPLATKFDTGGVLKRVYQAAMDALGQEIINQRTASPSGTPTGGTSIPTGGTTGGGATSGGGAGDKDNSTTPPPPPPPPPPAP